MREAVLAHEPDPGGDEHHHGEADPADIRLHPEGDPEQVADEHAHERAQGEECDSEDRHREALPHRRGARRKAVRSMVKSSRCMRQLIVSGNAYTISLPSGQECI